MQYYVGKNGQQLGPFGEEQIKARVASGEFSTSDLIWREGMAAWEPIGTVFNNPYMPASVLGPSPYLSAVSSQQLAGRGGRLAAVTLNSLIGFAAVLPGLFSAWSAAPAPHATSLQLSSMQWMGIGLSLILLIGLWIYQLTLYLKTGQTIGKKMMGIKVVRFTDGSLPGFGGLIGMREILPTLIAFIPLLGHVFTLVDLCFIFREDKRCIHDLIAETKVVVA